MPTSRSRSRSFERRSLSSRSQVYRQVHLDGLLLLEDADYYWEEIGQRVVFQHRLNPEDLVTVSLPGVRPLRVSLPEEGVPAGTPLNVVGDNSIVQILEERVELEEEPRPTLYDHLLED